MPTIADILRRYGPAYLAAYGARILPGHKKAIADIITCRTAAKGGRVYKCPDHARFEYKYHSCMNRHCPQCQNDQATKWLSRERKRLLNVRYFLLTFTLPKELRTVARANQKLFYRLLFSESWRAMQKLARNPKWLGGRIGALGVLHTWTRTLTYHPHLHYLVPAGCLTEDPMAWIEAHKKFFLPVRALSRVFRAMLRDALKAAAPELFKQIPRAVWRKDWVVHSKPAGNGQAVLKYFAPYVFRVAISNKRIIKLETSLKCARRNDQVTFVYKHPKTKHWTPMSLPVFEFLRRFLQHVLPKGFKKVRHFGFLASRNKELLARLQYKLGTVELEPEDEEHLKMPCCPICGKPMLLIDIVPPGGFDRRPKIHWSAQPQARAP